MSSHEAKAYLSERKVPQIFESMMAGLMYHRPDDHMKYLQECLDQIHQVGPDNVRWNQFLESKEHGRKSSSRSGSIVNGHVLPRPPSHRPSTGGSRHSSCADNRQSARFSPVNGLRRQSRGSLSSRTSLTRQGSDLRRDSHGSPLPPIGQMSKVKYEGPETVKNRLVLCLGGPGSGKATQCKQIVDKYPGWVHLSMGDILRERVLNKGTVEDKWNAIETSLVEGQMAPQEITDKLIRSEIDKNSHAKGIILEGYPRTAQQLTDFESHIGHLDMAFILDCEESTMRNRLSGRRSDSGRADDNETAVENRITAFREQTLPVVKYFDDLGKLAIINGDRESDEITKDLLNLFDYCHQSNFKMPNEVEKEGKPKSYNGINDKLEDEVDDMFSDKKPSNSAFSDKHFIVCLGGPGSGKASHCMRLSEQYPGYVHLSMGDILRKQVLNAGLAKDKWEAVGSLLTKGELVSEDVTHELLERELKKHSSAKGFILEGYPRTVQQLKDFNSNIGSVDLAFVLECDDRFLRDRLLRRGAELGRPDDNEAAIDQRLSFYKEHTHPVLKEFLDAEKLAQFNGDRDIDEVYFDVQQLFEWFLKNKDRKSPRPPSSKKSSRSNSRASRVGSANSQSSSQYRSRQGSAYTSAQLIIETEEKSRNEELPQCPLVLVLGGPGSKKSEYVRHAEQDLPNVAAIILGEKLRKLSEREERYGSIFGSGSMLPDEIVLQTLKQEMKEHKNAKAIIVEGFPRSKEQIGLVNEEIGNIDHVLVIDCEEEVLKNNLKERQHAFANKHGNWRNDDNDEAIEARIAFYKRNVLPVIGYFDKKNKVVVINGDQSDEQVYQEFLGELRQLIEEDKPYYHYPAAMSMEKVRRNSNAGQKIIIGICGAPGGEAERFLKEAAAKFTNSVVFKASDEGFIDNVAESVSTKSSEDIVFLENFPENQHQADELMAKVGDVDAVICIDEAEETLGRKGKTEMQDYKQKVLPVLGHFDQKNILTVVDGEKSDSEVLSLIVDAIRGVINGQPRLLLPNVPKIRYADFGRVNPRLTKHIIAVQGLPGGDMEPIIEILRKDISCSHLSVEKESLTIQEIQEELWLSEENLILLEGYPSSGSQIEEFNKSIGDLSLLIMLDTDEKEASQKSDAVTLNNFKNNVIPACAVYDDLNRLEYVNEDLSIDEKLEQIKRAIRIAMESPVKTLEGTKDLSDALVVLMNGAPGSGKATQCLKITDRFNFTHISIHDLLKKELFMKSEKSAEIQETMEAGEKMPDDIILSLLSDELRVKSSWSHKFIISDFPQNLEQGQRFEKEVAPVDAVIAMQVEESHLRQRLSQRGGHYTDEFITRRINTYTEMATPLFQYYEEQGKLHKIVSDGDADEVFDDILNYMNGRYHQ